ncbi:nitrile hydratase subunit beta [Alsobacter sp. R-9]
MNGAQDLGGMMGFGPVVPEIDEPLFHAAWEKRALAVTIAAAGLGEWNLDVSRHARETLPPPEYLTSSYYEIWIKGLTKLLRARGLVDDDEIAAGRSLRLARATARPAMTAEAMEAALARGGPCSRPATTPARFAVGDLVRTLNIHPVGHTRLPRYARGKVGRIERVHGVFVFPDSNAHGKGEDPRWCYGVVFDGPELWGPGSDPTLSVSVDCWEPYLEPAP